MGKLIFRHYRKGDEQQLADLFNAAFQRTVVVRTARNWHWRFVQSPGFEPEMCQIAEDVDKKKIVGAILVNLIETIPINQKNYLVGEINDVATLPDYTRRGIATKLMEMSINYMEQKKCDFSMLSTGLKNFARSRLYQKFGYFDVEKQYFFIQIPNILQLIRNFFGFAFFYPVFFILSYLPRYINRLRIKFKSFFKDFSYEIYHNKKHFEYMNAINRINPKNYEGYPRYDKTKLIWARIKVPTEWQKPTYIIIKKSGKIIGGSVITHQNINATKYRFKLRLGIIHEIFLDRDVFSSSDNLYLGYIFLIDKIIKAATRRYLGALLYSSTLNANNLNRAFKGMSFFKIQMDVIMIKELKKNLKFPKLKKPLYIPTYVTLGF
ncbi:MAG: GNAT family N-acetyltransferase [Promethearchaeota archaeon]